MSSASVAATSVMGSEMPVLESEEEKRARCFWRWRAAVSFATGSKYRAMSAAPRHESSGWSQPAETSRGQPTMASVRNQVSPALTARGVISSASGAGKPSMGVWAVPLLFPMPNRPLPDGCASDCCLLERRLRRLRADRIGTSCHGLARCGLPDPGGAATGRSGEQTDGFLLAEAGGPD